MENQSLISYIFLDYVKQVTGRGGDTGAAFAVFFAHLVEWFDPIAGWRTWLLFSVKEFGN